MNLCRRSVNDIITLIEDDNDEEEGNEDVT